MISLLLLETTCDFFEIGIGQVLLFTNPLRPRIGRLWQQSEKELGGAEGISQIDSARGIESAVNGPRVTGMEDLRAVLSIRSTLRMSRSDFLTFYRSLSPSAYKNLIDPLALYRLSRDKQWASVVFTRDREQISIVFQDEYDNMIQESFIAQTPPSMESSTVRGSILQDDPRFKGRVVPADLFYNAFDRLEPAMQLQVVTDPSRLIIWGENLVWIAISDVVAEQSVVIAFEVRGESGSAVYEMNASEIGVEYLIAAVNDLGATPRLSPPRNEEGSR